MDFDDIISLVNQGIISARGKPLSDVQRLVLEGAWHNHTYSHIASATAGYTEDYLKRDVGPRLWQLLSHVTGYTVNKRNIRNALLQWAAQTSPELAGSLTELLEPPAALLGPAGAEPADQPQRQRPREFRLALCSSLRIDVSDFRGRSRELAQLHQWIERDRCRLVLLWGLPDIGKTALALKAIEPLREQFDCCGYLELHPDLSAEAFLDELVNWLAEGTALAGSFADRLDWVLEQLAQRRCLLLVDQTEVLFESQQLAGSYRTGYSLYQAFLERVGRFIHQSCVVWISRERPREFAALQGRLVQSYELGELSAEEARDFLMTQGWPAAALTDWQALVQRYGGGPQLLKSLTPHLQVMHGGSLSRLLADELNRTQALPPASRQALEATIARLSEPERWLLYWLALAQAPVSLQTLHSAMVLPPGADVVQSLLGRSLCQLSAAAGSTDRLLRLNPVVEMLATEQAVVALELELVSGETALLHQLPLLRVTAPEAVQALQQTQVLQPLSQALERHYPSEAALHQWMQQLHQMVRSRYLNQPSYSAANLIHLCQALDISLSSFDFSNLWLWQANLQQVSLQGADLSQVRFQETIFDTALSRDLVVAFSPDGQSLAVGDQEGCLLLWALHSGRLLRFVAGGSGQSVRSLAFSPAADLLAIGSSDGTLLLWRLEGLGEFDLLQGHQSAVRALAFSPKADWLAAGDEAGCLYLWDLASGLERVTLTDGGPAVRQVQFDRSGDRLLSCSDDQSVRLWSVARGEPVQQFQVPPTAWVQAVGFAPKAAADSTLEMAVAAGYEDSCLYLWDVEQGQPVQITPIEIDSMLAMAVSPDGRFWAYSQPDKAVVIWDLGQRCPYAYLTAFEQPVWSLAFSPDSQLLTTASDHTVAVWQFATGTCLRRFGSHRFALQCLTFDGDSARLITGHDDALLRLWQMNATGAFARRPRRFKGHRTAIQAVAASPTGSWLASSSSDRCLRLWPLTAGRGEGAKPERDRLLTDSLPAPATVLAFSPNGHWLASGGDDGGVWLWPLVAELRQQQLAGSAPITALAFSPNSEFVFSGSRDRTIEQWQLASGECQRQLIGHQRQVHGLCLSADGHKLLSISYDGTARWWDLASGQALGLWQHPQGFWLYGCMATPTGQLIAIASDTLTVELWSVEEGRRLQVLSGHSRDIWRVSVSPDQRYLATASQDEEIRIWRLDLGTCVQVLRPDRPYEGVNIRGAKGLSEPEVQMLRSLGAVVSY